MIFTILFLTLASGFLSLLGAFILSMKKNWQMSFSLQMTAFSSGVLLSTAFLHLAPESIELSGDVEQTFKLMLIAILGFFILERFVLWYHHHHQPHGPRPAAYLIVVGDTIHNIIDGALIASSVMIQPELGLITALAVAAHELPQEIADFSVMVSSGISRKKALLYNAFSALSSVFGALFVYFALPITSDYLPATLAFSAGMFLYISLSDLIPELHHHTKDTRQKWVQFGLLLLGIITVIFISSIIPELHAD